LYDFSRMKGMFNDKVAERNGKLTSLGTEANLDAPILLMIKRIRTTVTKKEIALSVLCDFMFLIHPWSFDGEEQFSQEPT